MYLKSLTLQGFKSFADKVHLDFEPGIAAVVGPNGSGKSNISDALLWVFGERNAKHLRGQAMEDLIFSGSKTRKPSQVAEVSLVLDNRDGSLALDFDEIALTRRVYRSGESEYRINGSLVRRIDILDILHDAGFGVSSQSIISQGALDRILHSKPEELCVLVEEAAGILKHKQRKLKSQHKIEGIQASLLRINDIAREIKRQLAPLEKKAQKALEFKKLEAYKHELDLGIALDDLAQSKEKWQEYKAAEETCTSSINTLQHELKQLEAYRDDLTHRLQEKTEEQASAERNIRRCALALEKMDGLARLVTERIRTTKQNCTDKTYALSQSSEQLRILTNDLDRDKEACVAKEEQLEKNNHAYKSCEEEFEKCSHEVRALERDLSAHKASQRDARFQKEQLERDLRRVQESENKKEAESTLIKARQEQIEKSKDEHAQDLLKAEERVLDLEGQVVKLKDEEAHARGLVLNRSNVIKELENELEHLQERKATLQGRISSLKELERLRLEENPLQQKLMEQYAHLKRILDVVDVPKHLSSVVELYLASFIDALLIDLPDLVEYLEGIATDTHPRCAGSVYFAPCLDGMRTQNNDSRKLVVKRIKAQLPAHLHNSVRLLSEFIHIDDTYRSCLAPLFDACLVVDDVFVALQIQEHLWRKSCGISILVPEGFILMHDGRVQLNSWADTPTHQLFERKDEELTLTQELEALEEERKQIQNRKLECNNALQELQTRLMDIAHTKSKQEGLLASSHTLVNQLKQRLDNARKEDEALKKSAALLLEDLSDYKARRDSITKELAVQEDRERALKDQINSTYNALNPLREKSETFKEALNALKFERIQLQEALRYIKQSRESKEKNAAHLRIEIETLKQDSTRLEHLLTHAHSFTGIFERIVRAMTQSLARLEESLSSEKGVFSSYNEEIRRLRSRIQEVQAGLDKDTTVLSDIRIELAKVELQSQGLCTHIEEDLGLALEQALSLSFDESPQEMRKNRKSVQERIKALGTINLDAAQEYEFLKLRNDYLESQLTDVREAKAALRSIIRSLDERMEQDFQATYKQAQERFSQIFSLLFPGGSAVLELQDLSSDAASGDTRRGIEVIAQPAGKRITKMSLMSGGEKSLVALALLFALYGIRQAPFYVLDEVEAALDDMNLRRLLKYLESLRQETQLIMITHQRRTMEMADVLYGVSMQDNGITRVISQKLKDRKDCNT